MEDVVRRLEEKSARRIVGRYAPTAKNAPVKDLYERLRFHALPAIGEDKLYEYPLDGQPYAARTPHIRCVDQTAQSRSPASAATP